MVAEWQFRLKFPGTALQWSPDGARIIFLRSDGNRVIQKSKKIYIINSSGSGLRFVDYAAGPPDISPDGSQIVYADIDERILTSALDGSSRRRLANHGRGPVWSPDGSRIVFVGNGLLKTMAADGSDVRTLWKEDPLWKTDLSTGGGVFPPAWSPDGRRIAFLGGVTTVYGKGVIYTIGTDGSDPVRLEYTASPPAWSPDGNSIAFAKKRGDRIVFYTMRPDGSDLREVFSHTASDTSVLWVPAPSWSPDGSELLLWGENRVNVVRVADGASRVLPGQGNFAAWSPDGSRIAIYSLPYEFDGPPLSTVARGSSFAQVLLMQGWENLPAAKEGLEGD